MKLSKSNVNWFPKVSFIQEKELISLQFEYSFDSGVERIANAYLNLSKFNKIDPNITKCKLVEYINNEDELECSILESEMIWGWKNPMVKINLTCFYVIPGHILFLSKPFMVDGMKGNYFEFEIISLKESKGKTKFQHIMCIYSKEKINWEQQALERGKSFYFSLCDSISTAPENILDCEEKYSAMEENVPKDAVGMMLLNLALDSKNNISFSFTDDETTQHNDSFLNEEDEMSFISSEKDF
jgi:hypothetical protein